ncbi:MAG: NADP-dependent malic enzyme [Candidatus Yanofskybacteria bacterium]|nr:NADP-dependent malic enzyme [Candidatus Yanofskybacteria bacterium]
MDYQQKSIEEHKKAKGKISVESKLPVTNREELSIAYTPGVAGPCLEIVKNKNAVYDLTSTKNGVAVVSDGSAVLGLGNIGPEAALPVMEGKAVLFKIFAGIDAFPIVLNTQNTEEIISIVKAIAPTFGGINLEDISAPRCFEIEERLIAELDIPVIHDDQRGSAIVVLAGLINGLKLSGKNKDAGIVINGAGAAGTGITRLLCSYGFKNIVVCDSKGAIHKGRADLTPEKTKIADSTNANNQKGTLAEILVGKDVFIGVSVGNLLDESHVASMAKKSIIFALANPIPEIMPDKAKSVGAFIVASGRSDFPNQVNNVLAFPGIFKGAIRSRIRRITQEMEISAAEALAGMVKNPSPEKIIPDPFESGVAETIALAIEKL